MEEGLFETLAHIYKFPLVPERIIVNTQYLSTDYEGTKDFHLCIFSSQLNEKYLNKETLGSLVDGYRVFMDNLLSGYIIQPLEGREDGCKIFYANISESKDLPFWAFKKFC